MALTLNTGHALYGDLIRLYCVDDDNVIKDLKGDTCTPHANVTQGTGTYGRHFRTLINASNAEGVALTTGFEPKPTASPVGTTFIVINAGNSRSSRGTPLNTTSSSNKPGVAVYTGDVVAATAGTGTPADLGTTDLIGTGAHSFGIAVNGTSGSKVFANGVVENSSATNRGNSGAYFETYIGGGPTGGYGGFAADYVWVAHFRKFLSDAEILDLHNSLGASNAFGLVGAGAATATTLSGPSSGTTGVASTNFTVGANGTITGTVTVTPSDAADGGTFTPTSVAISSGTPTATFTYTPASVGAKTISISDDGGLTDATPLGYTSNAAASTYAPNINKPRSGMGVNFYGAR